MIKFLETYPKELESIDIKDIHSLLGGPTLIHLKGDSETGDNLFLSTLLHGNETTSFLVLQRILREISSGEFKLGRGLIIFIGNTLASSKGLRHLPDQVDYNRIWEKGSTAENNMVDELFNYLKPYKLFASIDIHNNTGKNPHYGCINSLDRKYLELARYFGEHTVYFTEPHNVQSMAFSKICPSTTIEAGLPGEKKGVDASYDFVKKVYQLDVLGELPTTGEEQQVYHTIGRMKISEDATIDFDNNKNSENDLSFISNIDSQNFEIVMKDSHFGYINDFSKLRVIDNKDRDITEQFFIKEGNQLKSNRLFIPSMFSKDIYVIKEDCLGYIMEIMIGIKQ